MIEAKGTSAQIQFDGQYVTIIRKGFIARTTVGKGEKRLHIAQISGVQWKPAGPFVGGFIQFTVPGGNERRSSFGSQTQSAAHDENSVTFPKSQQPDFEKLRAAIDQAIAAHHAPQPVQHAPQPAPAGPSLADELVKLGGLLQQGIITQQDFETAKAKILGG